MINSKIFRPNDIRGIYGKELTDDIAYKTGKAVVKFLKCRKIIIGRDMRLSSPKIFLRLSRGIIESGCDIIDIGLVDTPCLYFASGHLKLPGLMITASHNPVEYNGIKIVQSGAKPVDAHNGGLIRINEIIERNEFINSKKIGKVAKRDIFREYKKYVLNFSNNVDKNIKVVIDAGNGMAGKVIPKILGGLIKITPLFFKLDGRFPNHVPNPLIKSNLKNLRKIVLRDKADFGIAFDGDMDRVAFVDEQGRVVNISFIGALLTENLLGKIGKSGKVIYTSACSKIISETARKYGGKALREKVGHAYMKDRMRRENALLGVEHSGHFYFRENYFADSAIIAALIIIKIYSRAKREGKRFSDLISEFERYSQADEISIRLKKGRDYLSIIERHFRSQKPKHLDKFDGLTIEFDDFWFSARKSSTEPLLRINLEAVDKKVMNFRLKEILKIVGR